MMSRAREKISKKWSALRTAKEIKQAKAYKKDPIIKELLKDEDENFIKKIKKILLEKPSINKIEHQIDSKSIGDHHSKDFVAEIVDRLANNQDLSEYILQVYHCEYNTHKKKHIIVSKLIDNACCLRIYDEKVGYGVEIKLRCEQTHEALLLAKYIVQKLNYFKKFNIKIDPKALNR